MGQELARNTAGQHILVFAFNINTGLPVAADAANITANISLDGATPVATNDVNPTETQRGHYKFELTQAETNAVNIDIYPTTSSAGTGVVVVGGSRVITRHAAVFRPEIELWVQATIATVAGPGDFSLTFDSYNGNAAEDVQFDGMYLVFHDGPNSKRGQVISDYTALTSRVQFLNLRNDNADAPFPNVPVVGNRVLILGLR